MTNLPKIKDEFFPIEKNFENYLKEEGKVSPKTLRNYRADLVHFTAWATLQLKSQGFEVSGPDSIIPYFTPQLVGEYKSYHIDNQIPRATTKRRLSTLRNLSRFLISEGITDQNPTEFMGNLKKSGSDIRQAEEVLADFRKHLQKDGVSSATLKNYVSDVRQFLHWVPRRET